MIDLAVVIVNYETGAWLERCLRSLERARGDGSVDVVVIANASGDGSADVSEALGARLIRNDTNLGERRADRALKQLQSECLYRDQLSSGYQYGESMDSVFGTSSCS